MNIFKVLWTFCQIASLGLLSFGSAWWKMSLIAEDRRGPGQKKEHSKHSERDIPESPKPQLGDTLSCLKASLVALPFLSQFGVLPYMDGGAADALALFCSFAPRAPHFCHRAFAFAVPLSTKYFPLQFVVTGAFSLYVSQFKCQMLREAISKDLL